SDERAPVRGHTKRRSDLRTDGLDADTKPATARLAVKPELLNDGNRDIRWNGEPDADRAACRRDDGCVDANDLAVHVEQGTARVALVDGCVGLQIVVVRPRIDVACFGGDDADRHRAAKPKWVANRHHPV